MLLNFLTSLSYWIRPATTSLTRSNTCEPAPQQDDGMTVVTGGDATAIGEDTLASGSVQSSVVDSGAVTVASGQSSFTATAQSDCDDTVYASAGSFADVSGADFVFSFTTVSSSSGTTEDGTYATQTSTTQYFAIDFEGIDLSGGQMAIDQSFFAPTTTSFFSPISQGNLAFLDVDAQAYAEDTYVDVNAEALTVEDQLSTVAVIAVTDVG